MDGPIPDFVSLIGELETKPLHTLIRYCSALEPLSVEYRHMGLDILAWSLLQFRLFPDVAEAIARDLFAQDPDRYHARLLAASFSVQGRKQEADALLATSSDWEDRHGEHLPGRGWTT